MLLEHEAPSGVVIYVFYQIPLCSFPLSCLRNASRSQYHDCASFQHSASDDIQVVKKVRDER